MLKVNMNDKSEENSVEMQGNMYTITNHVAQLICAIYNTLIQDNKTEAYAFRYAMTEIVKDPQWGIWEPMSGSIISINTNAIKKQAKEENDE